MAVGRLTFLDAARAAAAFLVLLQHLGERLSPALSRIFDGRIYLGYAGVSTFFLISGFVIPLSIERSPNLKAFWRGRFYRLYPLFIASLVATTLVRCLVHELRPTEDMYLSSLPWSFLANLTLFEQWLHEPAALGLYWTLTYEVIFYGCCSIVYFGGYKRSLPKICIGFVLLLSCYCSYQVAHAGKGLELRGPLSAGSFLIGALVYERWRASRVAGCKLMFNLPLCVGAVMAIYCIIALLVSKGEAGDGIAVPATVIGACMGYAIFFTLYALKDIRLPSWLARLGEMSYSTYLLHGVLLLMLALVPKSIGLGCILLFVYPLSFLSYHYFEAPMVRLGKRRLAPVSAI